MLCLARHQIMHCVMHCVLRCVKHCMKHCVVHEYAEAGFGLVSHSTGMAMQTLVFCVPV
jgi:hypothetical protein